MENSPDKKSSQLAKRTVLWHWTVQTDRVSRRTLQEDYVYLGTRKKTLSLLRSLRHCCYSELVELTSVCGRYVVDNGWINWRRQSYIVCQHAYMGHSPKSCTRIRPPNCWCFFMRSSHYSSVNKEISPVRMKDLWLLQLIGVLLIIRFCLEVSQSTQTVLNMPWMKIKNTVFDQELSKLFENYDHFCLTCQFQREIEKNKMSLNVNFITFPIVVEKSVVFFVENL